MDENLPTSYDLIVVGTGLSESIVAAAAARNGKRVLHFDHRDYYGSSWASFSLKALQDFIHESSSGLDRESQSTQPIDGSKLLHLNYKTLPFIDIQEEWFTPSCQEQIPVSMEKTETPSHLPENLADKEVDKLRACAPETVWSKEEILKNSRRFNLDLSPKTLFARGDMVELLISSGICRYAEFRAVTKVCTYDRTEGRVIPVPCSRGDVFSSDHLSLLEKRVLMKTLALCVEFDKSPEAAKFQDFRSKTFEEFLESQQVRGRVRQYVMDSVAMASPSTDFPRAVANVQKFVAGIGRYGNTPYLWTMYGSGELPQCFCRLCAVFGGIYCLKRPTSELLYDDDGRVCGVSSDGQTLHAPLVLVEDSLDPSAVPVAGVSRAILITDRSLFDDDGVTLLNFPSDNGHNQVRILELPPSAMACPKGLFIVHLTTPQVGTAVDDLKHVVGALFAATDDAGSGAEATPKRPRVLWSLHFNLRRFGREDEAALRRRGVFIGRGPDAELDLDSYVVKAKEVFQSMFPGEEFLPLVPDPEDIVLEDEPEPADGDQPPAQEPTDSMENATSTS